MEKRIEAIDALRGLTIIMMILCASIGYASNLPAWMFHCQCPPPSYAFNPDVRGITWVDLVFPFFIFSMGAAFPLALGRKLERGESLLSISLGIVKRWAILVAFALVLGNSDAVSGSSASQLVKGLWRFGLWLALFAALWRTSRKWVNIAGWAAVIALMGVEQHLLGVQLRWHQNDIIILLLSTVALLGSFVWLLSRCSLILRALFFAAAVVTKLIGWDFAMYLVIAIPATVAGDFFLDPSWSGRLVKKSARCSAASVVAFAAVVVQLWGLFTRNVVADLVISAVLAVAFVLLTFRERTAYARIGWMGLGLLLSGIAFDFVDGGIAKDYCNMSYLLVTGGQASLTLCCLMALESCGCVLRNLTLPGRNPMIAYTIAWYVICPLLVLVGFQGWFDGICAGNPALGVVRGLIITCLMVACTSLFTKKKIYWRS